MGHGVDRNQAADGSGSSTTPIEENIIDAKGDLIVGTADNTAARLAVGANETRLVADSTQAGGLKYVADTTNYAVSAKGDLLVGTAADTVARKAVGTNGQLLVAASGESDGLIWTDYTREPINVNPNFLIDQINEGALYTGVAGANTFGPDGCVLTIAAGSAGVFKARTLTDPDNAAKKVLELTCTTADASLGAGDLYAVQFPVEGYDAADLMIGTASASKLTVMFTSDFSVAGTYGIGIRNSADDRSWVGTFTQAVANAREQQIVTLTLDTTGTWLYTNGRGFVVSICLASGSTFQGSAGWQAGNFYTTAAQANFMSSTSNIGYIGPIHIIPGGVALAYHKQDIKRELAKAQRYYEKSFDSGTAVAQGAGTTGAVQVTQIVAASTTQISHDIPFKVTKRASTAVTFYNPSAANAQVRNAAVGDCTATAGNTGGFQSFTFSFTTAVGSAVGNQNYVHWTNNVRLS